ncbi:pkb-activating kinase-like protein [Kappamyces sp. JEL0680]|nr:pkb-activating kinase-like protein [Kappamyces sp. JEL0680]
MQDQAPSLIKTLSQSSNLSTASSVSSTDSGRKRSPVDFEFGRILGEGSFSTVLYAREPLRNKEFAVKVLDKYHIIKENKVKYVTIEKDVLNKLSHKFIVRLYYTFQDSSSLYFVLQYCPNGDLLGLIKQKGRFPPSAAKFYIAEIAQALLHIHSNQIIHRDLKPENILLDRKLHIKVTDFGSAKILNQEAPSDQGQRRASFVGTAEYCSPELLNDSKATSFASDIWALGCIFFQMLVGSPPFKGSNEYQTFQKITKLEYQIPAALDADCAALIAKILVIDPDARPSLSAVLQDAVFAGMDMERLPSLVAPAMSYLEPLQKPEAAMGPVEFFDDFSDDSDEKKLKGLSLDDSVDSGCSAAAAKESELDHWLPDLSKTNIDPSSVLYSGLVVKVSNSVFPSKKKRGLLLTKDTLYILDVRAGRVGTSHPLGSIAAEVLSPSRFKIQAKDTSFFIDVSARPLTPVGPGQPGSELGRPAEFPSKAALVKNMKPTGYKFNNPEFMQSIHQTKVEKKTLPRAAKKPQPPEMVQFPSGGPWNIRVMPWASAVAAQERSPPWLVRSMHRDKSFLAASMPVKLSMEIKLFCGHVDLHNRFSERQQVFARYKQILEKIDRNLSVCVFGSSATGLCLQDSDIDIVVIDSACTIVLADKVAFRNRASNRLSKLAKRLGYCSFNMTVIRRSGVPLIKLTDRVSRLDVDISYQTQRGTVDAAELTVNLLNNTPCLRPLVLVLKRFLQIRNLNCNATGGIGGYGAVLLCTSFLKLHPLLYGDTSPSTFDANADSDDTLGTILLHFFHFFGKIFDYKHLALAPFGAPGLPQVILLDKKDWDKRTSNALMVMDPLNWENNVTAGASKISQIALEFASAYETLGSNDKWVAQKHGATYKGYLCRLGL